MRKHKPLTFPEHRYYFTEKKRVDEQKRKIIIRCNHGSL